MATVSYVPGTKKNTLGEVQIVIKLFVSQKIRPRVQTGVWVTPKRWGKKNEITIPVIEGSERDELLKKKELLSEVTEVLLDAVSHVESIDIINKEWAEDCVEQFHKQRRKAKRRKDSAESSDIVIDLKSLVTVMQEYLQQKKMSKSRFDHFNVLMRCVMRFELHRKATGTRNNILYLDKLTPEILTALSSFIGRECEVFDEYPEIYEAVPLFIKQSIKTLKHKPKKNTGEKLPAKGRPKPRGLNYVADLMIRFRTFIIWANDEGLTRNNPFRNHPLAEPVYGDPIYIDIEERKRLYEKDMSHDLQLENQRDIFVLQCLIGCRVGDYYEMTYDDIIDGAIEYIASKTNKKNPRTLRVPLTDTALEIIRKHYDPERRSLMPFISDQKYNDYIKEAFRYAGLDRMVTVINQQTHKIEHKPIWQLASSHMARRTFIGNIYKQVKDPNLVGSLSGHKEGSKAFARYRHIDEEMKRELVNFLE